MTEKDYWKEVKLECDSLLFYGEESPYYPKFLRNHISSLEGTVEWMEEMGVGHREQGMTYTITQRHIDKRKEELREAKRKLAKHKKDYPELYDNE